MVWVIAYFRLVFFFFNDTATTEIYTLSLHDALPISGRVGADHDALDQLVRVLVHQLAVLERPRLGLVGVAAEVLLGIAARQEARLLAHREAGAASTAQARGLELGQDLLGRHLGDGAAQGAVAAEALID